jgi:transcriptional regulator GlxA family with amidase domain
MEVRHVDKKTTKIGFLLLNNFTMIALASAVDPLRMANQLSGEALYSWPLISADGESITASDGFRIMPDLSIEQATDLDILLVVGGVNVINSYSKYELACLRSLDRKKVILGGICTGTYVLAHADLMNEDECSIHWEYSAILQESFPLVNCNNKLFTITPKRLTCSGGIAPMDMILNQIQNQYSAQLSNSIANMFVCDKVRSQDDQQRVPLHHSLHVTQPKLIEVIELMETNIEEPLELAELAHFVNISRRQQERLFHKYLGCPPSRYYLKLRLERAKQLLKQSGMSIIDVSTVCGFVSPAHFSRCYRKYIGISPREERTGIKDSNSAMPNMPPTAEVEPSFASIDLSIYLSTNDNHELTTIHT